MAKGSMSWESEKQVSVAIFSTKAECMARSEACKEAVYLRRLIQKLPEIVANIIVDTKNQSPLTLSSNPLYHNRMKHKCKIPLYKRNC